ncbi:SNF2-related protein [Streptomyces sp. NPDC059631]|uniref:SNF2-related protein n=1 Tax=unclassified Streptomyces TaxID=2593676 RepID=UPI0036B1EF2F
MSAAEAKSDKDMVRAVREGFLTALELVQTAHVPRDLPQASRAAWSRLAADPALAWTGLGLLADAMGAEVVRRSASLGAGREALQLGLRLHDQVLPGPAGVGAGQRAALHQAVLALLDAVVRPGADLCEPAAEAPAWSPAGDLLERAAPSVPPSALIPSGHMGADDSTRLLMDALGGGEDRAAAQSAAASARALEAKKALARAEAERARHAGAYAEALRIKDEADQIASGLQALVTSGIAEAELEAAREALARRQRELQTERLGYIRTMMAQAGASDFLHQNALPGLDQWEFRSEVRRVGEVEGGPLWVAEVCGRHADGRLPHGETVAGLGPDGWYVWRGPLRESAEAASDAAVRLVWSDVQDENVPDPYAPGSWPGFLIPQQAAPAVLALTGGGALDGWHTHEEEGGGTCRVEMSCRSGGVRLAVSAAGASAQEAGELCARRLLGVLAAEAGFGSVPWSPAQADRYLEELAREPWMRKVRRRSGASRGGGRQAEVSCLVDGVVVRAEAVAGEEPEAVSAAAWLLVQQLGRGGRHLVLDLLPDAGPPPVAVDALRERGVAGAVEYWDGPGGAEAVVASVELGGRRLWAAGGDREQALRGVLAAARHWTMAPGAAQASGVGAARPGWVRRSAWNGEPVGEAGQLRRLLSEGLRLCVAGVEDGRPGFVLVPPSGRGTVPAGGAPVWRVWTERGAVQVPGSLVPVALVAQAVVGREHEPGWDRSVGAWGEILRFGCEAVAAGQVRPGTRGDGSVVWRPGPWSDAQAGRLEQLAGALPPWAHSAAVGKGKGAMLSAGAAAELVLVALADELVRGPGTAAVWGPSVLTSLRGGPAEGEVARWLDAVEEIADAVPPPGVVLSVQPPPRPRVAAATLKVQIRLRPVDKAGKLLTLPELQTRLGAEHPAVLRALRALRKAAGCWPALAPAVRERADQVRVSPGEASLLLGHLGRALRRAGIEVQWPQQWARRLQPVVVAGAPAGAMLSVRELVDYRWQIRLDGTVLSAEECVRIAESAGTLVWLRDRWVLIDAVTAERARGGRLRQAVPAGEALTAVLLGSVSVGDDEHAELTAEGELGELVSLLSGDTVTAVGPPRSLNGELWPYQQDGLTWLANVTSRFGALLADDMGLGKSVQAIALILHRREKGLSQGLPVLVVAPTSMMLTWVRQLEAFAPTVPVRMYHGAGRTLDGLDTDTVVVTSYGTLLASQDELAAHTYSLIVADEAQHVKNASSKTARALSRLLALARVALTGTPVENQLSDLWSLLHWTNSSLFTSLPSFQQAFGALETGPAPEVAAALNRVVSRFMLRRRKCDPHVALQLPERIDSLHTLALTPTQVGLYTSTVQMAMEQLRKASGHERAGLVLRLLTHLRQICNAPAHLRVGAADSGRLEPALSDYQGSRDGKDSCKLAALDELVPSILDAGESIVVWTEFRTMAMLLHRHAADWGAQPLLHVGTMSSGERDAALDAFRRRRSRLLIVTYGSGGTGLDLTAANHAVLFDRPFNPAPVAQAVDRLHRPGQVADVHVHRLTVTRTVEDKIEQLLARKTGLLDALETGTALNPALLTDEELHALVALGTAS